MNMRTTKIVAPLVAMALCTPTVAFAQENSNLTTISGSTDVNGNFSLTRSISVINGNNSISKDRKTIYVNPGDTIDVKLDLKRKTGKSVHGFTSFKEKVSPIQESSTISGTRVVKRDYSATPQTTTLDKLGDGTFEKTDKKTIEFKVTSKAGFGVVAQQVTINYSYTAANEPGTYQTHFQPDQKFGSSTFNANELDLTIVVKGEDEKRPPHEEGERPAPPEQGERPAPPEQGERPAPPEQDERPAPPEQDEQAIPPKSNRSTVFSWLTKALGVLAFLGGTVWFIIKHIFRL
ncbi:membrane protein [Corynebacterium diphtheriae]|nr:membrane protein [Corynebacterium diphtheriae]CAB0711871.1 membrane protein [Corynebacterium diphtheriae]CAB0711980.1 membrane protein [Corynebacterium diphtheriae]